MASWGLRLLGAGVAIVLALMVLKLLLGLFGAVLSFVASTLFKLALAALAVWLLLRLLRRRPREAE